MFGSMYGGSKVAACAAVQIIGAQIRLFQKLSGKQMLEILPAQIVVTGAGMDFHHPIKKFQYGHIEGPTAKVDDQDAGLVKLFVEAVGDGGRRWLVDQPLNFDAAQFACDARGARTDRRDTRRTT